LALALGAPPGAKDKKKETFAETAPLRTPETPGPRAPAPGPPRGPQNPLPGAFLISNPGRKRGKLNRRVGLEHAAKGPPRPAPGPGGRSPLFPPPLAFHKSTRVAAPPALTRPRGCCGFEKPVPTRDKKRNRVAGSHPYELLRPASLP